MKKTLNSFDATKDLITLFQIIIISGIICVLLLSPNISDISYQLSIFSLNVSWIMSKWIMISFMILLLVYSAFQIYISRNIIHNKLMYASLGITLLYVIILSWKSIIVGYTASALIVLLTVGFLMSYINLLNKS